jgi:hypothetical protein
MQIDYDVNSLYPGIISTPFIPKMSLILDEGRVYGAKYHTVEPVFGNWKVLEAWARETYGEPSDIWDTECGRWYMNSSKFWFRKESDLTMFMMKWA